jgi:hypothetical protein
LAGPIFSEKTRTPAALHPGRLNQIIVEARFRPIPAAFPALSWWLYLTGRLTRRQLRIAFAAHEMAERRNYGVTGPRAANQHQPRFLLPELRALVGGERSESAMRALACDVRALARTGLVDIQDHRILFARSFKDLAEPAEEASWERFQAAIPNPGRTVPVPRRLLRALAGGFARAETAYVLAALLRAVFFDRRTRCFSRDGRMKRSWVAETFGLSLRAVTNARARLIALGWLEPLDAPQWAQNRYGVYDAVNLDLEARREPQRPWRGCGELCGASGGEPA